MRGRLCRAAHDGAYDKVQTLLKQGVNVDAKADPNMVFAKDPGPMHLAAEEGHKDVVELLLANGANAEYATECGHMTPFHVAVRNGRRDVVELLLANGASLRLWAGGDLTPLCLAAQSGHKDVAELLLVHGAEVNPYYHDTFRNGGNSPLHIAVKQGYMDVAELLLAKGANIEARNRKGESPLSIASGEDNIEAMKTLLAHGASVDSMNKDGFVNWTSPAVVISPGQFLFLTGTELELAGGSSSVTVYASSQQIATAQVEIEERQRVFGIIPNFYVAYNHNAAPLTAKLKFALALKASTDPVFFAANALVAGADQAGDTPNYEEGAKGFGQRFGASYTTGFSDIMIGEAVLPSLLHQDPRYFYQGTGTTRSRVFHALSSPFICKKDNGKLQQNFSSIGGDLSAGAIANIYYPPSNRGASVVFENALITTGGRMVNSLVQEFVLRRFTPSARTRKQ